MAWIVIDDQFDEHPKFAKAGPLAWSLWLAGLAYCNRNLTDGFIPWSTARKLINWQFLGPEETERGWKVYDISVSSGMAGQNVTCEFVIDCLLSADLWEQIDGGYQVHDYADWQRTKEQIETERAKKIAAGQAGGQASAQARGQASAQASAQAKSNPKPKPQPKVKTAPPSPPKQNGAIAPPAADYRSLIGDDYWSALDAFKKVDPALSNGWLDKALKRAPPGISPDRLFQALENALNRLGEDFQRNETQQFIKSKYGWANTIVDEEFADAQRTTP